MQDLTVDIEERTPVTVIRLAGRLAHLEVYNVKNAVDSLLNEGKRFFVLCLSETDFIDSAGIGVIVHWAKECKDAGGKLALVEPIEAGAKEVIRHAPLEDLFELYGSVDEAFRAIAESHGFSLTHPSQDAEAPDVMLKVTKLAARLENIDERLRRR